MSEPKKFAFKKSALSDKADKLWSESKNDFSASTPAANHVQLEKKSLGNVLSKISEKAKEKESEESQQSGSGSSFVFGSKISERIVKGEGQSSEESTSTSLTATELFKTAVKKNDEKNGNVSNFREQAVQEAERAKEVEKQHASTSVVEVTTGEEADSNIFQASCKIWVFDKERQQYAEKGVCTLRINQTSENGHVHHRIVARTSGTLRVVINSKIFSGMLLERPDRRIKISAMTPEASGVQILLLKFGFSKADTGAEADQFFNTVSDLLRAEGGESSRKRKADSDLNADTSKIRIGPKEEEKKEEPEKTKKGEKESSKEESQV